MWKETLTIDEYTKAWIYSITSHHPTRKTQHRTRYQHHSHTATSHHLGRIPLDPLGQDGCTHPDDEQQETDAQQKLGPLDFNRLVLPFRPER
jgi:hypothetical protein